jgi:hypothetical protein
MPMAAFDIPSDVRGSGATARTWLSLTLAVVAVTTALVGLGLGIRPSPEGVAVGQDLLGSIATFGLAVTFTVVGLILRRSRDDHSIGWLLLIFGAAVGLTSLLWGITYVAGLPGGDPRLGQNVAWLAVAISIPTWIYLATSLVIRFPTGRAESSGDAQLLRLTPVFGVAAGLLAAIRPGPFMLFPSFQSPVVLPASLSGAVTLASSVVIVLAIAPLPLGARSMIRRYRLAAAVERLQLRWFAYAAVLAFSGAIAYVVVDGLLARPDPALRVAAYVLFILGVGSLPIAVLEGITRHHLYEIDAIIGRTFAYGALTAILAGLYAASLRLFNLLFAETTGQSSEAALVLTTLVLATTFTPIKSRLEHWASARFPPEQPPGGHEQRPPDPRASAPTGAVVDQDLDARIEAIARRVAREVLVASDEARRPSDR